ncbi:hypothetical protein TrCOL_g8624 [Triparma columacea]|uniref:Uncharacterized protein n=1 Tax=Triparma columacea TaxID=722753 RepID=A0A9W7GA40_9STRA|nr:hypothetical protein TrCOL_g8624 [Triparma columacea]
MGRKQSRNAARVAKKRRTNIKPLVGTGRISESVEANSKALKKKRRKGEGGEDEFESERRDMEERFLAKEHAREARRGKKGKKGKREDVNTGKVHKDNEIIGVDRRGMEERIMGLGKGALGGMLGGGLQASLSGPSASDITVEKEINGKNAFALLDDSSDEEDQETGLKTEKIVRNPFKFQTGIMVDPDL